MKHLALLLFSLPMVAQTLATISETAFKQTQQGALYTGKIVPVPARGCRLTRGGESFSFTRRVYCVGVTGGDCDVTTAAGVVNIQLVPTGPGTIPEQCYYNVTMSPTKGDVDSEVWAMESAQTYQIKDVRRNITPTPNTRVARLQVDVSDQPPGCIEANALGKLTSTGVPCGTGSGGSGLPPTNATWSTVTGAWRDNNRTWASQ